MTVQVRGVLFVKFRACGMPSSSPLGWCIGTGAYLLDFNFIPFDVVFSSQLQM